MDVVIDIDKYNEEYNDTQKEWIRDRKFDMEGIYMDKFHVSHAHITQPQKQDNHSVPCKNVSINKQTSNYDDKRHFFSWVPSDIVNNTYIHSTQYGRITHNTILKKSL